MLFLKGVFENQKVDMRSQLSGLLPTNMGEELPTEGPLSMGALYSPVWALSQKGVGGAQWFILGVDPVVLPPILAIFRGHHTVCNDTAIGLKHSFMNFCDSLDVF